MPRVTRSTPRNSVQDRPTRWRMLLRRQRRFLRPAAAGFFLTSLVLIVFLVARSAEPGGTVASLQERLGGALAVAGLRVNSVVIEGRANTPEPLLRAALGVNKGDPIMGFSIEKARQRIASLTWVDQATVERRLPGTIVVYLQERRPFAIWQHNGKFVLIDRNGQLVANQDVAAFKSLPLVVGTGAPEAAAKLEDALTDRPALATRVMAAVRVADRRWNLHMNSGIDVLLPEGHEIEAMDRLLQLQQNHAVLDRPLQVIDMRLPDRLVVRPKPEAIPEAAGKEPAKQKT